MYAITVTPLIAAIGFALITLYVAVWAYRLETGVAFRPLVACVGSAFYVGLFFLVEGGSWLAFGATAPLDLLLLLVAGVAAAAYSFDAARILRLPDGRAGYRLGAGVPLAWLLVFGITVGAEILFLGRVDLLGIARLQGFPDRIAGLRVGVAAPGSLVLQLVGALFALSTGLVLGQTVGVGSRFLRRRGAARSAPRPSRA